MNHEDNWREIEETWIELANCTCGTETERPCLHCEPEAFKVWYQMKFGEPGFSNTYEYLHGWSYYPLERLVYATACCAKEFNLPYFVSYAKKEQDWNHWRTYCFKTVKEVVMHWRQELKK